MAERMENIIRNDVITVIYGNDPKKMTLSLLEKVDPFREIPENSRIGIKPNLVNTTPPENGATTHSEIIEGIVEYLKKAGTDPGNITILEGSWVGASTKEAFRRLGYMDIAEKHGVRLLDTKGDKFEKMEYEGGRMEISKTALELDYLIDVPVLKGHCQTLVTGALKNMKGIISDSEKRRFHSMGLHKPIAYLNKIIHADLCIVDGICGDLDFEDGGNPVRMNRMFCCKDPVLTDAYIASLMGYEPGEIGYISLAERLGVGSADLAKAEIIELNRDVSKTTPSPSRIVRELSKVIDEKDSCSACYANLIQALMRLRDSGELKRFASEKIAIGQGFKGRSLSCPGIGNCTAGFDSHVSGCPAATRDILAYLRNYPM